MNHITLTQVLKKHRIKLAKGHKNAIGMAIKKEANAIPLLPMYIPERHYQVNGYPEDFESRMLEIIKEQVPTLKEKDRQKQERRQAHENLMRKKSEQPKEEQVQEEVKKEPVYKKVVVGKKKRPRIKKV